MGWRKVITFIVTLFATTCCSAIPLAQNNSSLNGYYIHKEILPIAKSFEKDCGKKVDVHIDIIDMSTDFLFKKRPEVIGYCWPIYPSFIRIDSKWWNANKDKWRREELIYHELGHCVLYRKHVDTFKDGREESIMSQKMFSDYNQYKKYKKEYIKELCGK